MSTSLVSYFEETIEILALDGATYRTAKIADTSGVAVSHALAGLRVTAARIFDLG